MNNQKLYFRLLCALAVLMLAFSIGILAVGYKDLSIGRGATMALLAVVAVVFGVLGFRKGNGS